MTFPLPTRQTDLTGIEFRKSETEPDECDPESYAKSYENPVKATVKRRAEDGFDQVAAAAELE
jgi:hypothetical protein